MVRTRVILLLWIVIGAASCSKEVAVKPGWTTATQENKPWSRWWWEGKALTK